MLRSGLILFIAGLILTTTCYVYAAAKNIDIYGDASSKAQYVSYIETLSEILLRSPEANKNLSDDPDAPYFTSVDITSQVGKVNVKYTDGDTRIEYSDVDVNNLSCVIVGDTLKISEIRPVSFMGLSVKNDGFAFDGLRQIFKKRSSVNTDRTVTLYLNSSINVETLKVRANVGDVLVEGVSASEISVNVSWGSAAVKGCSAGGGSIKMNCDVADIVFENNTYSMCSVSVIKGDISAIIDSMKSNFETTLGSVSVVTKKDLSVYTIRMSTNSGKVKVDGEASKDTEYNQSGSSDSVWIKAGFGNLSLSSEAHAGGSPETAPPETGSVPETDDVVFPED